MTYEMVSVRATKSTVILGMCVDLSIFVAIFMAVPLLNQAAHISLPMQWASDLRILELASAGTVSEYS